MLLKTLESDPGRDLSKNIKLGSTLSNDHWQGERFHYCISNPPFGKKWEKDQAEVVREHTEKTLAVFSRLLQLKPMHSLASNAGEACL